MPRAQREEFKRFGMDREFLLRVKEDSRKELQQILFTTNDIVERVEAGEEVDKN